MSPRPGVLDRVGLPTRGITRSRIPRRGSAWSATSLPQPRSARPCAPSCRLPAGPRPRPRGGRAGSTTCTRSASRISQSSSDLGLGAPLPCPGPREPAARCRQRPHCFYPVARCSFGQRPAATPEEVPTEFRESRPGRSLGLQPRCCHFRCRPAPEYPYRRGAPPQRTL